MPRGYSYDHYQVPKRELLERATPPDMQKAATAQRGDAIPLAESRKSASKRQAQGESRAESPVRKTTRAAVRKAAPTGHARAGTPAKDSTRGGKSLARVVTSAKRVSRKATRQDTPKKR